jgi:hypothetical protein
LHYSSFIELGWKVTYVGEQAHHTKFPFNFFLGFCHFLFPNLQFLGFWKKNSWEAYSCPLFVCWLFSLGTSFLMHKLNVPILVLWKGIILFFSYKKWIKVRKQRDCNGWSVNTNLFYKSYIVYNSIVRWPTINKKNLMSCCILELWLWNISVFINLRLLDLFHVFILLLLKTNVSYIFIFVSLFKSYACASCIESLMSHSHFFNWNFLNMLYMT